MTFQYRPEVLDQLLTHGVRPTAATRPGILFRYLGELYRYELRRLRDARVAGRVAAAEYAPAVVALRRRYPLVSTPVQAWTVPGTTAEPEEIPLC